MSPPSGIKMVPTQAEARAANSRGVPAPVSSRMKAQIVAGDVDQVAGVDGPRRHRCAKMRPSDPAAREAPAMSISMIAVDTAKSLFQPHGIDASGTVQLKRRLRRSELISFFKEQPD